MLVTTAVTTVTMPVAAVAFKRSSTRCLMGMAFFLLLGGSTLLLFVTSSKGFFIV